MSDEIISTTPCDACRKPARWIISGEGHHIDGTWCDDCVPTCTNGHNAPFGIRCSVCNTDQRATTSEDTP